MFGERGNVVELEGEEEMVIRVEMIKRDRNETVLASSEHRGWRNILEVSCYIGFQQRQKRLEFFSIFITLIKKKSQTLQ